MQRRFVRRSERIGLVWTGSEEIDDRRMSDNCLFPRITIAPSLSAFQRATSGWMYATSVIVMRVNVNNAAAASGWPDNKRAGETAAWPGRGWGWGVAKAKRSWFACTSKWRRDTSAQIDSATRTVPRRRVTASSSENDHAAATRASIRGLGHQLSRAAALVRHGRTASSRERSAFFGY